MSSTRPGKQNGWKDQAFGTWFDAALQRKCPSSANLRGWEIDLTEGAALFMRRWLQQDSGWTSGPLVARLYDPFIFCFLWGGNLKHCAKGSHFWIFWDLTDGEVGPLLPFRHGRSTRPPRRWSTTCSDALPNCGTCSRRSTTTPNQSLQAAYVSSFCFPL